MTAHEQLQHSPSAQLLLPWVVATRIVPTQNELSGTSGGALPQRKPHLLRLWEPLVFDVGRAVEIHGPPLSTPRRARRGTSRPAELRAFGGSPPKHGSKPGIGTAVPARAPAPGDFSRPTEGDDVHAQLPGVAGAELAAQPLSPRRGPVWSADPAHAGPLTQQPPHATARGGSRVCQPGTPFCLVLGPQPQ